MHLHAFIFWAAESKSKNKFQQIEILNRVDLHMNYFLSVHLICTYF